MDQPACSEKITSVWRRSCFPRKSHISKTFIGHLSHWSDNDKNPTISNNESNKPLIRASEAPEIDAVRYTKKHLQQIITSVFQAQALGR